MYLKSLTLRGFLCYKDTTRIEFSPRLNVLVGPNGSGKSSILAGLRFVMGDVSADRAAMCLHQGASSKVLVGYASVEFDNSDRCLMGLDTPEVIIRRDFGTKKDQFTLNGRRVTRQELQSLLEAAGFSKTNPYYFVQQHEVTALTRMSHAERLKLLKEVAGTRVYDERRKEAASTLTETRERQLAINATLDSIITRMRELEEEQKELKNVLDLEKERECIESISINKQFEESEIELKKAETLCQELEQNINLTQLEIDTINQKVTLLTQNKIQNEKALEGVVRAVNLKNQSVVEREREVTALSLAAKRETEDARKRGESLLGKEGELKKLKNEENNFHKDCIKLESTLKNGEYENDSLRAKIAKLRTELVALLDRSQQGKTFSSIEKRNEQLTSEVQLKEKELVSLKEALKTTQRQYSQKESSSSLLERELQKLSENRAILQSRIEEVNKKNKNETSTTKLTEKRSELRDQIFSFEKTHQKAADSVRHQRIKLDETFRSHQLSATTTAKQWAVETHQENKVLGTLLENIKVNSKYHLAVETAAGNQLLNLLVDNRHTAVSLVSYLKKRRAGTTTITPLNEVQQRQRTPNYPQGDKRIKPLVELIECSKEVRPAVQQVWGKFLLVDNVDVGNEYVAQDFCSITIEGDVVSRKGLLSGGFRPERGLRLKLQDAVFCAQEEQKKCAKTLDEKRAAFEALNARCETARIEREQTDKELLELHREGAELNEQISRINQNLTVVGDSKKRLERCVQETEGQIENLKEEILRKRRDITMPFTKGLSDREVKKMKELKTEVTKLEHLLESQEKRNQELNRESREKLNVLNEVLRPKIHDLEQQLLTINTDVLSQKINHQSKHQIESAMAELQVYKAEVSRLREEQKAFVKAVEETEIQLEKLRVDENKKLRKQEQIKQRLNTAKETVRTSSLIRDELLQRERKGRDSKFYEKLSKYSADQLLKRNAQIAQKLQSFCHVNRKAQDQFETFIDEEKKLVAQREKLFKSEDAVTELMLNLDKQKDSTLLKTFESVNAQFAAVFEEIVNDGRAKLVLRKLPDEEIKRLREANSLIEKNNNQNDAPQLTGQTNSIDVFTGISMSVQFPNFKSYVPLESLSGGQKSVTALALMFALQRVDCAPLYVLDEVDSSLDIQYRGAVANLIFKQSREHQIIAITHKTQLIEIADCHLKTSMVNQITEVTHTNAADAIAISIADSNQENQRPPPPRPLPAASLQ